MNEQELIERTTEVLAESGAPENVEAAGIFNPRGHTGSMFAGGFIGDGIAGAGPDLVDAIGTVGGAVAASTAPSSRRRSTSASTSASSS